MDNEVLITYPTSQNATYADQVGSGEREGAQGTKNSLSQKRKPPGQLREGTRRDADRREEKEDTNDAPVSSEQQNSEDTGIEEEGMDESLAKREKGAVAPKEPKGRNQLSARGPKRSYAEVVGEERNRELDFQKEMRLRTVVVCISTTYAKVAAGVAEVTKRLGVEVTALVAGGKGRWKVITTKEEEKNRLLQEKTIKIDGREANLTGHKPLNTLFVEAEFPIVSALAIKECIERHSKETVVRMERVMNSKFWTGLWMVWTPYTMEKRVLRWKGEGFALKVENRNHSVAKEHREPLIEAIDKRQSTDKQQEGQQKEADPQDSTRDQHASNSEEPRPRLDHGEKLTPPSERVPLPSNPTAPQVKSLVMKAKGSNDRAGTHKGKISEANPQMEVMHKEPEAMAGVTSTPSASSLPESRKEPPARNIPSAQSQPSEEEEWELLDTAPTRADKKATGQRRLQKDGLTRDKNRAAKSAKQPKKQGQSDTNLVTKRRLNKRSDAVSLSEEELMLCDSEDEDVGEKAVGKKPHTDRALYAQNT